MAEGLHVRLLGGLAISRDGQPVTGFVSHKAQALLCYLVVTGRPHSREALATLLWGEAGHVDARASLRQVLSNLHKLLGPSLIVTRETVAFDRASPYDLDVEAFLEHYQAAQAPSPLTIAHLREAVKLCQGAFLEGFVLRDAEAFEEWQAAQRQRLGQLASEALHRLAAHYTREQDYSTALDYLTRLLALEPWREEAHRQALLLYALSGQRSAALAQYETCRRILAAELGVEPARETVELYDQVRNGGFGQTLERAQAEEETLPTPPHNLPASLTEFFGRDVELAQLGLRLRQPDCRLLTLVGPSGVGKTRLAVELATRLLVDFPDGAFFVSLAEVRLPDVVLTTIAETLGIREVAQQPIRTPLNEWLRRKHLLLVLDNFEHLLGAAPVVADLLAAAPMLRIVVTSREALQIYGEHIFALQPLTLPPPGRLPALPTLAQSDAVALFTARTRAVRPDFALTAENAAAVAEICRRLDGLPLAIELAAARSRDLSPEAILVRLESRLDLLTRGRRDQSARQQTMRSAIDWSYQLLSETEKMLFRRVSVFTGGFTLEAAQAVAFDRESSSGPVRAADGYPALSSMHDLPPMDILDSVTSLVDKSLLLAEEQGDGELRFDMLETIREYGLERLAEAGEREIICQRHTDFCLTLAEQAELRLRGRQQGVWLKRLEAEHANLRAALARSNVDDPCETGLRLGGALAWFWALHAHLNLGRQRLERLLSQPCVRQHRTRARAKALFGAGRLALLQGEPDAAIPLLRQSLAIWAELGHTQGLAYTLMTLGRALNARGDPPAARAHIEQGLLILRDSGDAWGIAWALAHLGDVTPAHYDSAAIRDLWQESVALFREVGDKYGLARALIGLAGVVRVRSDYAEAHALLEEALALYRELDDQAGVATALSQLGVIARFQGDLARARQVYEEALEAARSLGDSWEVGATLREMGVIARLEGNTQRASALLEESLEVFQVHGFPWGIAASLTSLGEVARQQGNLDRAVQLLEEGITRFRAIGDEGAMGWAVNSLGLAAQDRGDYEWAAALHKESLSIRAELGAKCDIAISLEGLAGVAVGEGYLERTARLLGAAAAIRDAIGSPLSPLHRAELAQIVDVVRAELGGEEFVALRAEGQRMTLEDAIAYGLCSGEQPRVLVHHAAA